MELREQLANLTKMPLESLRPDDRLVDDLSIDLTGIPELFWFFEEKHGLAILPEETAGQRIMEIYARIQTFNDLVDYLAELIEKPQMRNDQ